MDQRHLRKRNKKSCHHGKTVKYCPYCYYIRREDLCVAAVPRERHRDHNQRIAPKDDNHLPSVWYSMNKHKRWEDIEQAVHARDDLLCSNIPGGMSYRPWNHKNVWYYRDDDDADAAGSKNCSKEEVRQAR